MEMNTAEKIRFIAKRKNFILGDVAEGTGQTRQNFSNKIKRNDFKESELSAIADFLGCDLKIVFIDKETQEEY
jgi:hypothetical protein